MNLKTVKVTYFQVRVTHIHANNIQTRAYERICVSLLRVFYSRISSVIAIYELLKIL